MSERDRLIEAMARTSCNDFDIDWDREVEDRWLHYARVALAAKEVEHDW